MFVERSGSGVKLRSDSRLREPGFESCAVVLKPWAGFPTLHFSSSLSCINEYLAIDSGGNVYEQPLHINCKLALLGEVTILHDNHTLCGCFLKKI